MNFSKQMIHPEPYEKYDKFYILETSLESYYKIKFTTAKMPKNNNVRPKITVNIMLNGSKLMDKNLFLYKSNHVITTIEITTK